MTLCPVTGSGGVTRGPERLAGVRGGLPARENEADTS